MLPHLHKRFLCKGCEDEHSGHEIASYTEMKTSVEGLKTSLKKIKENIDTLEEVIENIKYNLDGTKRIYKRYYNISLDIIKKFLVKFWISSYQLSSFSSSTFLKDLLWTPL